MGAPIAAGQSAPLLPGGTNEGVARTYTTRLKDERAAKPKLGREPSAEKEPGEPGRSRLDISSPPSGAANSKSGDQERHCAPTGRKVSGKAGKIALEGCDCVGEQTMGRRFKARQGHQKPKRKPLKRNNPEWQQRLQTATDAEWVVAAIMKDSGTVFRVSRMQSGKTRVPHWQFRWDDGGQLDYCPSKGNWWHKDSNTRGECSEPGDVISTVFSFQGKAFQCKRCQVLLTLGTLRLRDGLLCNECNEDIMFEAACEAEYIRGM